MCPHVITFYTFMKRYIFADIIDYHDEDPEGQVDFAQNTTRPENLRKLAESDNEDILIAVACNSATPEDVRSAIIQKLHLGTWFEFPFIGDDDIEYSAGPILVQILTSAGYDVLGIWLDTDDYSLDDYGVEIEGAGDTFPFVFEVITVPVFDDNICNALMGEICQILSDRFNCTPLDPAAWFCNTEGKYLYI